MKSVMTRASLVRSALAIAIAVAAGGVLAVSTPASAAVGDWERITPYNSDLVVSEPLPYTVNNAQVDLEAYDSMHYPGQWKRTQVATNTYTFENRWSHQCLDTLDGFSTDPGTPVVQMPCNGSTSQKWLLTHDPSLAAWHISNVWSKLYLGVDGGTSASGAGLIQGSELPNNVTRMFQIW